jgi:protein TonB
MRSWLFGAPAPPVAANRGSEREDVTRADRGPSRSNPYNVRGAESLGPDWMNEFSAWVEEHKRYPEQAAMNDEDGTNMVQIRIHRDGRVEAVSLEQRSGSSWLDMGTVSLFRDRRLPPFPPDAKDDDLTIEFTMQYIIVR